jgi:hypothetical protein
MGTAERKITMKRSIVSSAALASVLVLWVAPNALADQDRACSNAALKGTYGFFTGGIVVPTGTPRGVIGRWNFDGLGHFSNSLTQNNGGTIVSVTDAGTYTVAADCTGKIFPGVGGGVIEIVLVDGGNEFYQLRTAPSSIVLIFSVARRQFPDD